MTDHYFFEGSWAIPPKYPYTAKTAKKNSHNESHREKKWQALSDPGPFFFQKKNKVLAQAIAHQKDHAPLNEKKFNSVEQLPKPCPWKNDAPSLTSYCWGQNPVK